MDHGFRKDYNAIERADVLEITPHRGRSVSALGLGEIKEKYLPRRWEQTLSSYSKIIKLF